MSSLELKNWAWLLNDLLGLIINKLVSHSDYVRFSAVCKSWLLVAQEQKLKRMKLYRDKQLPLLMIPTEDNSEERRDLYSLKEGKFHEFQLQVPYNKRCCGSSHGWIATTEENLRITLINLFASRTISLPPIGRAPVVADDEDYVFKYEYHVQKVILSVDPCFHPYDYVVVTIDGVYGRLALIKSGDELWTYIESKPLNPFSDVIYFKGQLHVSDHYGRVLAIDTVSSDNGNAWSCKIKEVVSPPNIEFAVRAYIVELSDGNLLLAKRFLIEKDHEIQWVTGKFKVYKLLVTGSELKKWQRKWVEVKSIGDRALFLGDNYSMSIFASHYPNCRKNCIYFTDDHIDNVPYVPFGPRDMGIFNLEDGSIETHYTLDPNQKHMPPAVWIVPTRGNNC